MKIYEAFHLVQNLELKFKGIRGMTKSFMKMDCNNAFL